MHVLIALLRDGFHPESPGGTRAPARRRHAGARLSAHALSVGRRARAFRAMAEIQFAAGATT